MNLVARQLVLALDCGIIQDLEHQDSTLNIDARRPGMSRIAFSYIQDNIVNYKVGLDV
jgi:hypothetical protein